MSTANIPVELHSSVIGNKLFNSISNLDVSKTEIFKYGILNEDVPKRIKENDFEYLESKVPFLYGLYNDFIELDKNKIISLADGETAKKISETIGVGVGLLYTIQLLEVNPNTIKKIPPPNTQKGKYLDFKLVKDKTQYEVETKGTIYHAKKNALIEDIQLKKNDSNNTACKYGVITLANNERNKKSSKIVICDDFNNKEIQHQYGLRDFLNYYRFYFSFIMDSTYYNRLVNKIENKKLRKNSIRTKSIKHTYIFDGNEYIGQYFDKRLILDFIADFYRKDMELNRLFRVLTAKFGRQKFFMGLDKKLVELMNARNIKELRKYFSEPLIIENDKRTLIRDADGVIFICSINGADKQIENGFMEKDVKERLSYIVAAITNTPHECGAPCRSKDKEGKPCEKLTFRDHCHFHRD